MKRNLIYLLLAIVFCFSSGASAQPDWSYEGKTGPEHWGELNSSYIACEKGRKQSPIQIEFSQVNVDDPVKKMIIDYKPTLFSLHPAGYTIEANAASQDNTLILDEKEYQLVQFHFHTPSEHQVNGQFFDMELHLVHQDANGQVAVLAVMILEGKENETLASLWSALSKPKMKKEVLVDVQALVPSNSTIFTYDGSLTTPPCTEGVQWAVVEEPIEMSKEQIQAFQQIFPHNQRPIQPLNNRTIWLGTLSEANGKNIK